MTDETFKLEVPGVDMVRSTDICAMCGKPGAVKFTMELEYIRATGCKQMLPTPGVLLICRPCLRENFRPRIGTIIR